VPPEDEYASAARVAAVEAEQERIRILIDGSWNGTERIEGIKDWVREWRISNNAAQAAASEARRAAEESRKQSEESRKQSETSKRQSRNSLLVASVSGFFTIAAVVLGAILNHAAIASNQALLLHHH
jgi:hypothetical protein